MTTQQAYGVALLAAVVGAWLLLSRPSERLPTSSAVVSSAERAAVSAGSSQAVASSTASAVAAPAVSVTPEQVPEAAGADLCPSDMVLVSGRYCPFIAHRCEQRLGVFVGGAPVDGPERCGRFANSLICEGRPSEIHVCMDRHEYPNVESVRPAVFVTAYEAQAACEVEGKSLCHADEWALACEGRATWPYPYGIERKEGACNIDRPEPRKVLWANLSVARRLSLLSAVDGRSKSGTRPRCTSPFGVRDTTGNVAEWVIDPEADTEGIKAVWMGGHYGLSQGTCRSRQTAPSARSTSHRVGFRCCARPKGPKPRRRLLPNRVRLPRKRRLL